MFYTTNEGTLQNALLVETVSSVCITQNHWTFQWDIRCDLIRRETQQALSDELRKRASEQATTECVTFDTIREQTRRDKQY